MILESCWLFRVQSLVRYLYATQSVKLPNLTTETYLYYERKVFGQYLVDIKIIEKTDFRSHIKHIKNLNMTKIFTLTPLISKELSQYNQIYQHTPPEYFFEKLSSNMFMNLGSTQWNTCINRILVKITE